VGRLRGATSNSRSLERRNICLVSEPQRAMLPKLTGNDVDNIG